MTDQSNDVALAVDIMSRALALLDDAGSHLAAVRLQHAIDTLDPLPAGNSMPAAPAGDGRPPPCA